MEGTVLCLSDGTRWSIQADAGTKACLDSLVSIMRLNFNPKQKAEYDIIFSPLIADSQVEASSCCASNPISAQKAYKCLQYMDFRTLRICHDREFKTFCCAINLGGSEHIRYINLWRSIYPIYLKATQNGGLPFHSALLAYRGDAYLLAGKGGMGKSTACFRIPADWVGCCDDEALVVRTERNRYRAHPFPTWSEYLYQRSQKTWDVQESWPLRAFFFIEQSSQDWVEPVEKGEAAGLINRSSMQVCQRFLRILPLEDRRRLSLQIFTNACEMARSIPAYRMGMTLTGRFWEMMLDAVGED